MGFFDRLFGGKKDDGATPEATGPAPLPAAVLRLKKKVSNKYGQPQDRQAAIRALADMGTPEAVGVLLSRFTFRIEQTIGDEDEKRMVFNEVVRLGSISVQPMLDFLEKENSPYWVVKALREIIGDDDTVTHLLEIIDRLEAVFDRDIERKVELVSNLREFTDPRVREKMLSFVQDENEELRVHALEGLASLGQEDMAAVLIDRLLDEGETQRVRTAILNLLIEKKWKLRHRKDQVRKVLPQTFWIDDVGVIHRR